MDIINTLKEELIMEFIKRTKKAYLILSSALIFFGICLIIWPEISAKTLCIVTGAVIAVFGVVKLLGYFSNDRFGLAFQFDFALGIFLIIAGILMIIHPKNIITSLPIIFGVFILIDGAFKLQTATDAKRFGLQKWWAIIILAVLTCIFGGLLILNPFESAITFTVIFGITLIIDGIQNLCVAAYTVKTTDKKTINIDYEEIKRD